MSREDTKKYYAVLELPPDAPFTEVKKKYLYLKAFYMGDSMELEALNGDAPYHKRQAILAELDNAYNRLKDMLGRGEQTQQPLERPKVSISDEMKDYLNSITSYSGPVLKEIRQKMGVNLHDMASVTKVQKRYLEEIEAEQFIWITAEVYLRGYVIGYARYLSLDDQKVAADYMNRYRMVLSNSKEKK